MTISNTNILGLLFIIFLSSCGGKKKSILDNRNFNDGNWLIVVEDKVKNTMFVIDDEKVLKENPFGLLLGPMAECGSTTCDGFLQLFKDGELITHQEFLSHSDLIETKNIIDAYKKAIDGTIHPENEANFKRQCDSLIQLGNVYPTRYHTQPDDKDIIWYYKFDK